MFNRSTREAVSSRASLPSQSENHIPSVPNICPKTQIQEIAVIRDEERALTGTWVIGDVRLAMQKGYRILEIHELYEYVTRYDPETR